MSVCWERNRSHTTALPHFKFTTLSWTMESPYRRRLVDIRVLGRIRPLTPNNRGPRCQSDRCTDRAKCETFSPGSRVQGMLVPRLR
jgi:hypothetical protein